LIKSVLNDSTRLEGMTESAIRASRPDAAAVIARRLISLMGPTIAVATKVERDNECFA